MTDQSGGGSHLLYFPYTVATPGQQLRFKYQARNRHTAWIIRNDFSFVSGATQQALVYISTTVPSLSAYPPLANILWRPAPGDPLTIPASGYAPFTASLDAWVGQAIWIAFAEVDNQWFLNFGVDDIAVTCAA